MKITSVKSHVLRYELDKELGYSQQYYKHRTAHIVEVNTDEGITGWGECFGPGNIALANKYIIEKVIQPLIIGEDPLNKEHIWQKVYNILRDSGQKGMPIQALSGVDIALWDILCCRFFSLSFCHLFNEYFAFVFYFIYSLNFVSSVFSSI